MKDYNVGAMEALSWAYALLERCNEAEDFAKARERIKDMILRLAMGAAESFRRKMEFLDL